MSDINMSPTIRSAVVSIAPPTHEEIAQCARGLWTEASQPCGRDEEFWLKAERRLLAFNPQPDVTAVILATLEQPVTRPNRAGHHAPPAKAQRGR
jgi:hypothetical protein